MSVTESKNEYSISEEIANSFSHSFGVIFGIVGFILLLNKSIEYDADFLSTISMSIYGVSIIILFLASTLYHAIPYQSIKRTLKICDHCAIYLLIAGTYTPFLLISLRTPLGIGLMAVIWGISLCGVIFKVAFVDQFEKLSLWIYLTMGWLSLIIIYQLSLNIEFGGLALLAIGGMAYSVGVIFYVSKRIPFNHAIWHGFVLTGSVCHFLAIYYYVEPI